MDCERGATGKLIVVKQVSSVSFRVFQPLPFYCIIKIKIGKALATREPPHACLVACSERRWCVPWSCCSVHQRWGSALPLPGRISLQHLSYHCPICFSFPQPTFYVSWSSPAALPSSALISRALSFLLWQFSLSHRVVLLVGLFLLPDVSFFLPTVSWGLAYVERSVGRENTFGEPASHCWATWGERSVGKILLFAGYFLGWGAAST